MKLDSYWTDSAPAFAPRPCELPAQADVAIVGGGFTGLSAALALAKRGAKVVVLEAGERVAAEASGRNGGHVNNGLAVDYADVAAKFGAERARAWYRAYDDAVDTVARLVRDEAIDCDFLRHGKLKLATRPAHQMARSQRSAERLIADGVDTDVELLDAARVRAEVAQRPLPRRPALQAQRPDAHGPLRARPGGARPSAAARRSIPAPQRASARTPRLSGQAHRLHTARGTVSAQQVLLATGATRHGGYGSFGWLRRRIVPIGSFIVVTEPLGAERARGPARGARTYVTVANIHHYFRLTRRPPAGVRRARALRDLQPAVGCRRAARSCAPGSPRSSRSSATCGSTTAGAAWST